MPDLGQGVVGKEEWLDPPWMGLDVCNYRGWDLLTGLTLLPGSIVFFTYLLAFL